jgi:hypothetical protein
VRTRPGSRVSSREMEMGMADSVTVYSDATYKGKSQTFAPGRYDRENLAIVGNDNISSIKVSNGSFVAVYADAGFLGARNIFRSDCPNLSAVGWNDRISSLIVGTGSSDYLDSKGPSRSDYDNFTEGRC